MYSVLCPFKTLLSLWDAPPNDDLIINSTTHMEDNSCLLQADWILILFPSPLFQPGDLYRAHLTRAISLRRTPFLFSVILPIILLIWFVLIDPCDCLGEKLHRQQVKVWLACWSCSEEPIEDRAGVTLCCGSVHALMTLITQGERTYNMFISPQFQEKKLVFNVCLLEV